MARRIILCAVSALLLMQAGAGPDPYAAYGICPLGHYCPVGSGTPLPCPPGTSSAATGLYNVSQCVDCLAGYFCNQSAIVTPFERCLPGFTCPGGDVVPAVECTVGHYCDGGDTTPNPCASGTYQNATGQSSCFDCPSGYYCEEGQVFPTDCPKGYFCPPLTEFGTQFSCPNGTFNNRTNIESENECEPCTGGEYCEVDGLVLPSGFCKQGHFCTLGSNTRAPGDGGDNAYIGETCADQSDSEINGVCPRGHYCPEGSVSPTKCPPGTENAATGQFNLSHCQDCQAGYFCNQSGLVHAIEQCLPGFYCPGGDVIPTELCTLGHYCDGADTIPNPCPAGSYQNTTGKSFCHECPSGFYCEEGQVFPTDCPKGYFCPPATEFGTQFSCPNGTFNNRTNIESENECEPCTGGEYCEVDGLVLPSGFCKQGHFCTLGSNTRAPGDGGDNAYIGETCADQSDSEINGVCPRGHYCPEGSVSPTKCPPGTENAATGQFNLSHCQDCQAGYFCNQSGLVHAIEQCLPGFYCPGGDVIPTELCTLGHYCDGADTIPNPCPAGSYQNTTGKSFCHECPSGFYCEEGQVFPTDCPKGYFCPPATEFGTQFSCPNGTFNNRTNIESENECEPCTGGEYCEVDGLVLPSGFCKQGHFCTLGSNTRAPGDGGDNAYIGETCADQSDSEINGVCPRGHYCPERSASPTKCPPGTENAATGQFNLSHCQDCQAGYFCNQSGLVHAIEQCLPGFYCPGGDVIPTEVCTLGHYCDGADTIPNPCPAGSYQNTTGMSFCHECPSGFYCEEGQIIPVDCPKGYFCPPATEFGTQFSCPNGTFNNRTNIESENECEPCTGGEYCEVDGLVLPSGFCKQGHFCTLGSNTRAPGDGGDNAYIGETCADQSDSEINGVCPRGHYCPERSASPTKCPPGTENAATGQFNLSHCQDCQAGYFCNQSGLVHAIEQCLPGFYCPGGDVIPTEVCTLGHYCDGADTIPNPCPAGSYQNTTGMSFCHECPSGFYCEEGQIIPVDCPKGYFCPPATEFRTQFSCPNGTFNNRTNIESENECEPCTGGEYCEVDGLVLPSGFCKQGHFCTLGSNTRAPGDGGDNAYIGETCADQSDSEINGVCPRGHYCPERSASPTKCPPGTENAATGQFNLSHCQDCQAGYFCNQSGLVHAIEQCLPGFYCPGGDVIPTELCTLGHYCDGADTIPNPCPAGSYQNTTGKSFCHECPSGFYCEEGQVFPTDCPKGYFCPPATEFGTQFSCPNGTFNNRTNIESENECEPCTGGEYCEVDGLVLPSGFCKQGHFCTLGSNTRAPGDGGDNAYIGETCADQSDSEINGVCPRGHYCPERSASPTKCPPGTENAATGQFNLSHCQDCQAGYFCNQSGLVHAIEQCLPGFYCPGGDVIPTELCTLGHYCDGADTIPNPCPAGSYQNTTGKSFCHECPSGFYCEEGQVFPTDCPKGYFCPPATEFGTQFSCPNGTFNNRTNIESENECEPCTGGEYCEVDGLVLPSGFCKQGHFCTLGSNTRAPGDGGDNAYIGETCADQSDSEINGVCPRGHYCPERSASPTKCPPGTENAATGQFNLSHCQDCQAGYFCNQSGLVHAIEQCLPGFYCPGGDVIPTELCTLGHYCDGADTIPNPCPAGSYQNTTGMSFCHECPSGFYCEEGQIIPVDCPKGYFCPPATEFGTQFSCPNGTFNNRTNIESENECEPCTGGEYCEVDGLVLPSGFCKQGHFCTLGSNTRAPGDGGDNAYIGETCADQSDSEINGVCPRGHYCPERSASPTKCPPGTENAATGQFNLSHCQDCQAGYFCNQSGLVHAIEQCLPGFYCPGGDVIPTELCTLGHYCDGADTIPNPCPAGSYQNTTGKSFCHECPSGFYCEEGQVFPTDCPKGYFCPPATEFGTQFSCPNGTFNNRTNIESENECEPCTGGEYCEVDGLVLPSGFCKQGHFCTLGSNTRAPGDGGDNAYIGETCADQSDSEINGVCPRGHYCPERSASPTKCPPGTENAATGQFNLSHCQDCQAGYFCNQSGLVHAIEQCLPGFYCPGGDVIPTELCTLGHYCDGADTIPNPCPAGSYQNTTGMSFCHECPSGFYCEEGQIIPVDCPKGYFCPPATEFGTQFSCPNGTFNNRTNIESENECEPCTGGEYCEVDGLVLPSGFCKQGHFCTLGSNTRAPGDGGDNAYIGETCADQSDSEINGVCPRGHYCPERSASPTKCPPGTENAATGQFNLSHCQDCQAGYFCNQSGLVHAIEQCLPGFYCPGGDVIPTELCTLGHYCDGADTIPNPCPAGSYQNTTGKSFCHECPSGFYCEEGQIIPVDCPKGYFCPPATEFGTQFSCPNGTFNNRTNIESENECEPCTGGEYCEVDGLVLPSGFCKQGHFCTLGSNTRAPGDGGDNAYIGETCADQSDSEINGVCPRGHYCPEGSVSPTKCPPGTENAATGQFNLSHCHDCQAGYFCNQSGLVHAIEQCLPGFYCPGGDVIPTELCTLGHYCDGADTIPNSCPAGSYQNTTGKSFCHECPSGFYCEEGQIIPVDCPKGYFCPPATEFGTQFTCPNGTFNNRTNVESVQECEPCTGGDYCEVAALVLPTGPCEAGYFCGLGSNTATPGDGDDGIYRGETCSDQSTAEVNGVCPLGHYCPEGTKAPVQCPTGTASPARGLKNATECAPCRAGFFCPDTGQTNASDPCEAGFYCLEGTARPTLLCTVGHFCGGGDARPAPCAAGTFTNRTGQEACQPCPSGFYCEQATVVPADCPTGHYCPPRTKFAFERPCSNGTFSNVTNVEALADCEPCAAGAYCATRGLTVPTGPCDQGFFCSSGSSTPTPGADEIFASYNGETCVDQSASLTSGVCPMGHYCPPGTSAPEQCPPGTMSAARGLWNISQCVGCLAGYFCNESAIVVPLETCLPRFYCPGGDVVPTLPCTRGHYCPGANVEPVVCAAGTYQNDTAQEACRPCPAGYYCLEATREPDECPTGHVCPEGTKFGFEHRCPNGTFSNQTGLESAAECTPCAPGFYCGSEGLTVPTARCDAGHYCGRGSKTPAPGSNGTIYVGETCNDRSDAPENGVCPAGHYCPEGSGSPVPCPAGTISAALGLRNASMCEPCSPGFYCGESGTLVATTPCAATFYCPGGDADSTEACTLGHYCPGGDEEPIDCPAGTYAPVLGLAECDPCPAGTYCDRVGTVVPSDCPAGYYCPEGTASATQYPCGPGTFSVSTKLTVATECLPCPAGTYCGSYGLTAPEGRCGAAHFCSEGASEPEPPDGGPTGGLCGAGHVCLAAAKVARPDGTDSSGYPCPSGHYCPVGSSHELACDPGTYQSSEAEGLCDPCPEGFKCQAGGTITPKICPLGRYCPGGDVDGLLCVNGTYGRENGLERADQCAQCAPGQYCLDGNVTGLCTAGYYCRSGAGSPTPNKAMSIDRKTTYVESHWAAYDHAQCPPGHYCPVGTVDPILCPNATVRNWTHGASVDDCMPCPAGYECIPGDPVPVPCPRGYYSPRGEVPIACPRYTYNSQLAAHSLYQCLNCPAGAFCDDVAIAYFNQWPCKQGHYCIERAEEEVPCPAGRYQPALSARSLQECLACPEGYYCDVAQVNPIYCADPANRVGYYCPLNSANMTMCPPGAYCPQTQLYYDDDDDDGMSPNETVKNGGTGTPLVCPAGYYCPQGSLAPIKCFNGTYCPEGSDFYRWCPLGYEGIAGSNNTRTSVADACSVCPAGTYGTDPLRMRCEVCPPGYVCLGHTSSSAPTDRVLDRGYVCPAGAYCPEGSGLETYCAPGAANPLTGQANASACAECKSNTHQELAGQAACKECSSTSEALGRGNARCSCVGLNRAFQASGLCPCEPGYEWYDATTFKSSTGNGLADCQPVVYERCTDDDERDHAGACVKADACSQQCGVDGGELDANSGLCVCDNMPQLDEACDEDCRDAADTVTYDPISMSFVVTAVDPSENATAIALGEIDGLEGTVDCNDVGVPCAVFSMTATEGSLQGNYGSGTTLTLARRRRRRLRDLGVDDPQDYLIQRRRDRKRLGALDRWTTNNNNNNNNNKNNINGTEGAFAQGAGMNSTPRAPFSAQYESLADRILRDAFHDLLADFEAEVAADRAAKRGRRLDDSGSVASIDAPVVCINVGDTILFDVSNDAYPVYVQESLLNTNEDFDYSGFTELAEAAASSTVITAFAFTFREAGLYVFEVSDTGVLAIFKVMLVGTECSTRATFTPMTESNLNSVSAKVAKDIVLDPDWEVLGGLLLGLCVVVFGLIGALYWFRKHAWSTSGRGGLVGGQRRGGAKNAHYRTKAKIVDLEGKASKGSVMRRGGDEGGLGEAGAEDAALFEGGGAAAAGDDTEDLDEEELARQLQRHHDLVEQEFFGQRELVQQLHDAVTHEADELKRLLAASLADARGAKSKLSDALKMLLAACTARRLRDGVAEGAEGEAFRLVDEMKRGLAEGGDRVSRRIVEELGQAVKLLLLGGDNNNKVGLTGAATTAAATTTTTTATTTTSVSETLRHIVADLKQLHAVVDAELVEGAESEARRRAAQVQAFVEFTTAREIVLPPAIAAALLKMNSADDFADAAARHLGDVLRAFSGRCVHFVAALDDVEQDLTRKLQPAVDRGSVSEQEELKLAAVGALAELSSQLDAALRALFSDPEARHQSRGARDSADADRRDLERLLKDLLRQLEDDAAHKEQEQLATLSDQLRSVLDKLDGMPEQMGPFIDDRAKAAVPQRMDPVAELKDGAEERHQRLANSMADITDEDKALLRDGLDADLAAATEDLSAGGSMTPPGGGLLRKGGLFRSTTRSRGGSMRSLTNAALEDDDALDSLKEQHSKEWADLEAKQQMDLNDDDDNEEDDLEGSDDGGGQAVLMPIMSSAETLDAVADEQARLMLERDRAAEALTLADLADSQQTEAEATKAFLINQAAMDRQKLKDKQAADRVKLLRSGKSLGGIALGEKKANEQLEAKISAREVAKAADLDAAQGAAREALQRKHAAGDDASAVLDEGRLRALKAVGQQLDSEAERRRLDLETRLRTRKPRKKGEQSEADDRAALERDLEAARKAKLGRTKDRFDGSKDTHARIRALLAEASKDTATGAKLDAALAAAEIQRAKNEQARLDASLEAEATAKRAALQAKIAARRQAAQMEAASKQRDAVAAEYLARKLAAEAEANPDDVDAAVRSATAKQAALDAQALALAAQQALDALDGLDDRDVRELAAEIGKRAEEARSKFDDDLDAQQRAKHEALRSRLQRRKQRARGQQDMAHALLKQKGEDPAALQALLQAKKAERDADAALHELASTMAESGALRDARLNDEAAALATLGAAEHKRLDSELDAEARKKREALDARLERKKHERAAALDTARARTAAAQKRDDLAKADLAKAALADAKLTPEQKAAAAAAAADAAHDLAQARRSLAMLEKKSAEEDAEDEADRLRLVRELTDRATKAQAALAEHLVAEKEARHDQLVAKLEQRMRHAERDLRQAAERGGAEEAAARDAVDRVEAALDDVARHKARLGAERDAALAHEAEAIAARGSDWAADLKRLEGELAHEEASRRTALDDRLAKRRKALEGAKAAADASRVAAEAARQKSFDATAMGLTAEEAAALMEQAAEADRLAAAAEAAWERDAAEAVDADRADVDAFNDESRKRRAAKIPEDFDPAGDAARLRKELDAEETKRRSALEARLQARKKHAGSKQAQAVALREAAAAKRRAGDDSEADRLQAEAVTAQQASMAETAAMLDESRKAHEELAKEMRDLRAKELGALEAQLDRDHEAQKQELLRKIAERKLKDMGAAEVHASMDELALRVGADPVDATAYSADALRRKEELIQLEASLAHKAKSKHAGLNARLEARRRANELNAAAKDAAAMRARQAADAHRGAGDEADYAARAAAAEAEARFASEAAAEANAAVARAVRDASDDTYDARAAAEKTVAVLEAQLKTIMNDLATDHMQRAAEMKGRLRARADALKLGARQRAEAAAVAKAAAQALSGKAAEAPTAMQPATARAAEAGAKEAEAAQKAADHAQAEVVDPDFDDECRHKADAAIQLQDDELGRLRASLDAKRTAKREALDTRIDARRARALREAQVRADAVQEAHDDVRAAHAALGRVAVVAAPDSADRKRDVFEAEGRLEAASAEATRAVDALDGLDALDAADEKALAADLATLSQAEVTKSRSKLQGLMTIPDDDDDDDRALEEELRRRSRAETDLAEASVEAEGAKKRAEARARSKPALQRALQAKAEAESAAQHARHAAGQAKRDADLAAEDQRDALNNAARAALTEAASAAAAAQQAAISAAKVESELAAADAELAAELQRRVEQARIAIEAATNAERVRRSEGLARRKARQREQAELDAAHRHAQAEAAFALAALAAEELDDGGTAAGDRAALVEAVTAANARALQARAAAEEAEQAAEEGDKHRDELKALDNREAKKLQAVHTRELAALEAHIDSAAKQKRDALQDRLNKRRKQHGKETATLAGDAKAQKAAKEELAKEELEARSSLESSLLMDKLAAIEVALLKQRTEETRGADAADAVKRLERERQQQADLDSARLMEESLRRRLDLERELASLQSTTTAAARGGSAASRPTAVTARYYKGAIAAAEAADAEAMADAAAAAFDAALDNAVLSWEDVDMAAEAQKALARKHDAERAALSGGGGAGDEGDPLTRARAAALDEAQRAEQGAVDDLFSALMRTKSDSDLARASLEKNADPSAEAALSKALETEAEAAQQRVDAAIKDYQAKTRAQVAAQDELKRRSAEEAEDLAEMELGLAARREQELARLEEHQAHQRRLLGGRSNIGGGATAENEGTEEAAAREALERKLAEEEAAAIAERQQQAAESIAKIAEAVSQARAVGGLSQAELEVERDRAAEAKRAADDRAAVAREQLAELKASHESQATAKAQQMDKDAAKQRDALQIRLLKRRKRQTSQLEANELERVEVLRAEDAERAKLEAELSAKQTAEQEEVHAAQKTELKRMEAATRAAVEAASVEATHLAAVEAAKLEQGRSEQALELLRRKTAAEASRQQAEHEAELVAADREKRDAVEATNRKRITVLAQDAARVEAELKQEQVKQQSAQKSKLQQRLEAKKEAAAKRAREADDERRALVERQQADAEALTQKMASQALDAQRRDAAKYPWAAELNELLETATNLDGGGGGGGDDDLRTVINVLKGAMADDGVTAPLVPVADSTACVEYVLEKRHSAETSALLAQQYTERSALLSSRLSALLDAKATARAQIIADIKNDEDRQTAFEKLDGDFFARQHQAQMAVAAELGDRFLQEEAKLRRRQMAEHFAAMKELDAVPVLHREVDAATHAREMAAMEQAMEAEKEAKLVAIEADRRRMEEAAREEHTKKLAELAADQEAVLARDAAEAKGKLDAERAKHAAKIKAAEQESNTGLKDELLKAAAAEHEAAERVIQEQQVRQSSALKKRLEARSKEKAKLAEKKLEKKLELSNVEVERMKKAAIQAAELEKEHQKQSAEHARDMVPPEKRLATRKMWAKLKSDVVSTRSFGSTASSVPLMTNTGQQRQQQQQQQQRRSLDDPALRAKLEHIEKMAQKLDKLDQIEKLVADIQAVSQHQQASMLQHQHHQQQQQGLNALAASSSATTVDYHDAEDPAPQSELVAVRRADISRGRLQRLEFGEKLVKLMGMGSSISLEVAEALPSNDWRGNAFRNSFAYKGSTVWIHIKRLSSFGDVALVLLNAISHIKVNPADLGDDNAPGFVAEFHRNFKLVTAELVKIESKTQMPTGGGEGGNRTLNAMPAFAGLPPQTFTTPSINERLKAYADASGLGDFISRYELNNPDPATGGEGRSPSASAPAKDLADTMPDRQVSAARQAVGHAQQSIHHLQQQEAAARDKEKDDLRRRVELRNKLRQDKSERDLKK